MLSHMYAVRDVNLKELGVGESLVDTRLKFKKDYNDTNRLYSTGDRGMVRMCVSWVHLYIYREREIFKW